MFPLVNGTPFPPVVLVKNGLVLQCAWCSRYRLTDGSYGSLDSLMARATSHGICPDCTRHVLAELNGPLARSGAGVY